MGNNTENNVAASAITLLGQINPLIGIAAALIGQAKAIRDAVRAGNPTLPDGTLPTDAEIIGNLVKECGLFTAESAELRLWLESLVVK